MILSKAYFDLVYKDYKSIDGEYLLNEIPNNVLTPLVGMVLVKVYTKNHLIL